MFSQRSHISYSDLHFKNNTPPALRQARGQGGRRRGNRKTNEEPASVRSPSKGHSECSGSGGVGKGLGLLTGCGDGEGETGIEGVLLSTCVLSPRPRLPRLDFYLTEQRKNQALPHSSWNTKEAQPGLLESTQLYFFLNIFFNSTLKALQMFHC